MLHRTEQEEATDRDQLEMSKASRKMVENSTSLCVTNGRNCLVSTCIPTCNNVRDGDDDNDNMEDLHVKCRLRFNDCKCTNSLLINSNASPFPTQRECSAAAHFGARRNGNYDQWIMQHPSALENFKEIVATSEGKRIVMFLDYDGTLSPIVDDPDHAFMDEEMRDAVREVARCFPTAIVTGRSREKVYKFVKLDELYYAGSHGMDIRGPRNTNNKKGISVLFQPAGKFLPMICEVYKLLVERTGSIPGAKVENNKFCLSVHYRCVDPQKWASLAEEVNTVITKYPNLRLTQGKKVLEIRPIMRWDKGKALEFLLQSLGYVDLATVFPIYIGDDRSDEDAFKVLQQRRQGAGILVSKSPKDTNASYSLREPAEVMKFLLGLVRSNKVTIN